MEEMNISMGGEPSKEPVMEPQHKKSKVGLIVLVLILIVLAGIAYYFVTKTPYEMERFEAQEEGLLDYSNNNDDAVDTDIVIEGDIEEIDSLEDDLNSIEEDFNSIDFDGLDQGIE